MSTYQELPSIYRVKRQLSDVDQLANDYFEKILDLNPVLATELGRKGVETLYPDYSPAGEKALHRLAKKTLKKVGSVLPIDDVDLVTLDALQERLSLYRAQHKAGFGYWQLNNITSVPQEVRSVFDLMKRNSREDWEHIIGRMHRVPEALDGLVLSLEAARADGKISPRRQVDIVIEQTAAYYAPGGFFDELAAEVAAAEPELAEAAAEGAEHAKDGYRHLNDYLVKVLQPAAPARDAVGREAYSLHSRSFLGTTVDLDETYAWGVKELESIIARQREVAEEIEPGTIWTSELGYEFLKQNLDDSEGQVRFEFLRYLGWPGQAPSYKIGERLWLQLREQALARGEDMRQFHTRALMLGSVGLDTLRRALTDEMMLPLEADDDDD